MNISLNDSEIKSAIKNYVTQSGFDTIGKNIDITISVGRKGNGAKAEVVITDKEESQNVLSEETESTMPYDEGVDSASEDTSLFGSDDK